MNLMVKLIIIQIITCLIQYYIATTHKVKNVLLVTFLFNFANLLCYLFNGDMPTVYSYILICIRSFIYVFRDKIKAHKWHPIIPLLFITIQCITGALTMTNPWQLIPVIAPCFVCYYMWFWDTQQRFRIGNIIGNGSWFVYNMNTGLYIVAIGRIVTVMINAITYFKKRKGKNENCI